MSQNKPRYDQDLIQILAHDLRTPISSAMSFIQLARQFGPLNEKQEEFIEKGLNALTRMDNIVDDVMEMRRLDREQSLKTEPCSLTLLIGEAVSFLEGAANAKQVRVDTDVSDNLPSVAADPNLIRQMLNNLVGNAIKYNREEGTVTVVASDVGDKVQLVIQDTGYGIDAEELTSIFEPFYRAKNHSGERVRGTGLGLAIVKLIVEKHGGDIVVESKIDEGTTFTVNLPKTPPADV